MLQIQTAIDDGYVQVDGMRAHYRRAGSGTALILLHGLVGSTKTWDQNIRPLASERTVYALDLPNMGESEKSAEVDPGLAATADWVAAWMDAMGLADADIVGHSHGGSIALMLAARHPGRVRRLMLFAPANPFCNAGERLIRFYGTTLGQWCARRIPSLPDAIYRVALGRMYGDPKRIRQGALDAYTINLNGTSIAHVMGVVRRWDADMEALRRQLERLSSMPALIVWGDLDRAVNVASSRSLQAFLPLSSLLVVGGVGHLAFEESPEICNRAMLAWLRGAEVGGEVAFSEQDQPMGWDRAALRA